MKVNRVSKISGVHIGKDNSPNTKSENNEFQKVLDSEIGKLSTQDIVQYLEYSYSGAKMLHDEETCLRIARAIAAFKAPTDQDIFTQEYTDFYYSNNL